MSKRVSPVPGAVWISARFPLSRRYCRPSCRARHEYSQRQTAPSLFPSEPDLTSELAGRYRPDSPRGKANVVTIRMIVRSWWCIMVSASPVSRTGTRRRPLPPSAVPQGRIRKERQSNPPPPRVAPVSSRNRLEQAAWRRAPMSICSAATPAFSSSHASRAAGSRCRLKRRMRIARGEFLLQ